MITKVEFGLLMHIELMKEDSESRLSHNLKAKTSCDRQTNVTRLNFQRPRWEGVSSLPFYSYQ